MNPDRGGLPLAFILVDITNTTVIPEMSLWGNARSSCWGTVVAATGNEPAVGMLSQGGTSPVSLRRFRLRGLKIKLNPLLPGM